MLPLSAQPLTPQQNGVLILNKTQGLSSAECLRQIKRFYHQKKIGHAGTLDPLAQGVLVVLLGSGTKCSQYLMENGEKVYSGEILLGTTTDTWDIEGQVLEQKEYAQVTVESIHEIMQELLGSYEQEVPQYSAAKFQGKPLYEFARKGIRVPSKSKTITVFDGQIELVDLPYVHFRVRCGSGTYIRSLAHSLGMRLGCGATLKSLTREYSTPFSLEEAHSLEALLSDRELFLQSVLSIPEALPSWRQIRVGLAEQRRIEHGNAIQHMPTTMGEAFSSGEKALMLSADGEAIALSEACFVSGEAMWRMTRVL